MPTTWNPSDIANTTLSNGNLTAKATASGGVRATVGSTSGKLYFEATFVGVGGSNGAGVANPAALLSNAIVTGTNAAIANSSGGTSVNGTVQTGIGTFSAGGTVCVAFDMAAKLVWFRNGAAGNWNGSGTANPATGTGGFSVSGLPGGATTLFPFCGGTSSAAPAVTANFGDTAYVGTPPAGFSSVGAVAQQGRAVVMA